jgi:hypothetical protein
MIIAEISFTGLIFLSLIAHTSETDAIPSLQHSPKASSAVLIGFQKGFYRPFYRRVQIQRELLFLKFWLGQELVRLTK